MSKSPTPDGVRAIAGDLPDGVRIVASFVGWDGAEAPFEVHPTLEAGAAAAAGVEPPDESALERAVDARRGVATGRQLLGLYTGGSLAHEAVTLLEPELGPIAGNVGHGAARPGGGHALFDLGEAEYTEGRPHPMVDLEVRTGMLEQAAGDERVGCVLLDVVLGFASHPDPAGGIADAVRRAAEHAIVVAHVCGTPDDPQDSDRQAKTLQRRRRDRRPLERRGGTAGAESAAMRRLRIAMLTYSLRPRGGVVHALEISEALAARGHEVELIALGPPGESFFREPTVPSRIVRYETIRDAPFDERIMAMLAAYRDGLADPLAEGRFDLIHSQDCLSANAALELRDAGIVPHVIRTVHHVDDFTSPSLVECQDRSILRPDALLCVSEPWIDRLAEPVRRPRRARRQRRRHPPLPAGARRRRAPALPGRVRPRRPVRGAGDRRDRAAQGLADAARGIRPAARARARARPAAGRRRRRDAVRLPPRGRPLQRAARGARTRTTACACSAASRTGSIESLYRAADVFAFPSTKEGFGLAALEALASGLPVVASELDEFAAYLSDGENAVLVPVGDGDALGAALARLGRDPGLRGDLRAGGLRIAGEFTWERAAIAHERVYDELLQSLHAVGTGRV